MSPLRELQAAMRAALLDEPGRAPVTAILDDGLGAEARLAIYRHHVLDSLTEVLGATYPVVRRLVDERFFAYAADRYIRRHPPAGPYLFEYGAAFADFLAGFPPCAHLAYLPDVARLEWAINVAAHAPDAVPLDPRALQGLDPTDAPRLRFGVHPSLTLLASPWPVDRIWRANLPDSAETTVDLAAGGARLAVCRRGEQVVLDALEPAPWALRAALAGGRSLEEAAAAALGLDPGLDLAAALRALLEDGTLIAFTLSPREEAP